MIQNAAHSFPVHKASKCIHSCTQIPQLLSPTSDHPPSHQASIYHLMKTRSNLLTHFAPFLILIIRPHFLLLPSTPLVALVMSCNDLLQLYLLWLNTFPPQTCICVLSAKMCRVGRSHTFISTYSNFSKKTKPPYILSYTVKSGLQFWPTLKSVQHHAPPVN